MADSSRAIVYIDGFNLYFALNEKGWRKYLWLDVYDFAKSIIPPSSTLVKVKYFTSRISGPPDKQNRQSAIIQANDINPGTEFLYGTYQAIRHTCRSCGNCYTKHQEKKTDVNIATAMVVDGFRDKYDEIVLVSEDSDLVAPLSAIRSELPEKRIHLASPPGRFSYALNAFCHTHAKIKEYSFRDNQLPDPVIKPDGYAIRKPAIWV